VDAYEAIVGKRDTREYEDRPIPDDAIHRLLQAARMAGSSKNEQPIRLLVVRGAEQKQALAACGDFTTHLPSSPLVIVVVRTEGSRAFDAGRAAQNMMIAAHAMGIASCPVGIQHDDRAREVLGTPANTVVAMAITFGYPRGGRAQGRGDHRLPLEDYVHWERWGVHQP
jgi:nitroreductase